MPRYRVEVERAYSGTQRLWIELDAESKEDAEVLVENALGDLSEDPGGLPMTRWGREHHLTYTAAEEEASDDLRTVRSVMPLAEPVDPRQTTLW